ncbi:MAG: site-2 protease family protein [Calditrichaeota bacterium]|nr:site-2 protease family protein [Calditrichota bacterium]
MSNDNYEYTYPDYSQPTQKKSLLQKVEGKRIQINILLFLLTILTTYYVNSLSYSLSIISILLAHEMGHYLMCRKYRIDVTLPYFIPVPLEPFGTMGAFIRMKSPIPSRKALFDVGAAGPIAGLIVTIPVLIIGLKLSTFVPQIQSQGAHIYLGESLLFSKLAKIILGPEPKGFDTMLHPMAYAGWAGLFVTALNLLPIGQLDGGHVLYALFGRKSQTIYKFALGAFIVLCALWYQGWILLVLLLIWFGFRHPNPIDDFHQIDGKRRIVGYFLFVIFLISFVPVPFHIN